MYIITVQCLHCGGLELSGSQGDKVSIFRNISAFIKLCKYVGWKVMRTWEFELIPNLTCFHDYFCINFIVKKFEESKALALLACDYFNTKYLSQR